MTAPLPVSRRSWPIWLAGGLVFLALVYLLRSVLLPFVAGMAVAYFLDPVCDRLERAGCSRNLATALVTSLFALLVVVALLVIVPLLVQEIGAFILSLPDFVARAQARLLPFYQHLQEQFGLPAIDQLVVMLRARLDGALGIVGEGLQRLASGGAALANLLSLVFITPVVTFYLLRDWDRLVARIDALLPRDHAADIREQARLIDLTLAGFARGQALVCLALGLYYAIALVSIGLPFGIVVGLGAGLLTFIPYVGALSGFVVALAIALASFAGWDSVLLVLGIFGLGQILEGNVLTPKLVGERVGLHPVWIIFALLAGGALFGFLGLLLAVPVAAAIGVLVRFSVLRYRASRLYLGHGELVAPPPAEKADKDAS